MAAAGISAIVSVSWNEALESQSKNPGASGREQLMDMAMILPIIVQALGGVAGGNILGALTRGGGGPLGRTIAGVIGGLAAGQGLPQVAPDLVATLSTLLSGDAGARLGELIVGAGGGGVLGLITGLLVRPKA
jgi:hypothetical protein